MHATSYSFFFSFNQTTTTIDEVNNFSRILIDLNPVFPFQFCLLLQHKEYIFFSRIQMSNATAFRIQREKKRFVKEK